MIPLEVAANAFTAACILLAGRNNVHTWWTGIVGCTLFGWLFYRTQLYADMMLQGFYVVTGAMGWWHWVRGADGAELPVRHVRARYLSAYGVLCVLVTVGHAWVLHRFTDAFAPLPDSAVLAFSVLGQLLLMGRRVESWWCWLLVNTVAAPLFFARGLHLTSALYLVFWINAIVSLRHWRKLARASGAEPNPEPTR